MINEIFYSLVIIGIFEAFIILLLVMILLIKELLTTKQRGTNNG